MIFRLIAVLGIAAVAYLVFAVVGLELSVIQALICGVFFVGLDFFTTRAHSKYLDKIGA